VVVECPENRNSGTAQEAAKKRHVKTDAGSPPAGTTRQLARKTVLHGILELCRHPSIMTVSWCEQLFFNIFLCGTLFVLSFNV
jgi:hypothetical protein